jgi:hypothetical protein
MPLPTGSNRCNLSPSGGTTSGIPVNMNAPADSMLRFGQIFLAAFCVLFALGAIKGFADKKHERHVEELVRDNIKFDNGFILFTCGGIDSIIRYDVDQNTFAISPIGEYELLYTSIPRIKALLPLTYDLAFLVTTAVGSGYSVKTAVDLLRSGPKISFSRRLKSISSAFVGAFTGYSTGVYVASLFPLLCDYNSVVDYFEDPENQRRIEHFAYIVGQASIYECAQQLDTDIDFMLIFEARHGETNQDTVGMLKRERMGIEDYDFLLPDLDKDMLVLSRQISRMKREGRADDLTQGIYTRNRERTARLQSLYVQDKHDFSDGEFVYAEKDLDACLWEQAQVLFIVEQEVNEESWLDQTQLEHDFKYKPRLERVDYLKSWRASLLAARPGRGR